MPQRTHLNDVLRRLRRNGIEHELPEELLQIGRIGGRSVPLFLGGIVAGRWEGGGGGGGCGDDGDGIGRHFTNEYRVNGVRDCLLKRSLCFCSAPLLRCACTALASLLADDDGRRLLFANWRMHAAVYIADDYYAAECCE